MSKEENLITRKRFTDLFDVDMEDSFTLTSVISNRHQVCWDSGKYAPFRFGWTTFYEKDDSRKYGMKLIFRAKTYKELVNYLKNNQYESWRLTRND